MLLIFYFKYFHWDTRNHIDYLVRTEVPDYMIIKIFNEVGVKYEYRTRPDGPNNKKYLYVQNHEDEEDEDEEEYTNLQWYEVKSVFVRTHCPNDKDFYYTVKHLVKTKHVISMEPDSGRHKKNAYHGKEHLWPIYCDRLMHSLFICGPKYMLCFPNYYYLDPMFVENLIYYNS